MPLSLTSQWFIAPGQIEQAIEALVALAGEVQAGESATLTYLVHVPYTADPRLQSLPPAPPGLVLFFESYLDVDAFLDHLNGPIFTAFVANHGQCFVNANGKPYTTVQFLSTVAGYPHRAAAAPAGATAGNQHPCVMFEIIAGDSVAMKKFYQRVFGWQYQVGSGGFSYVHFPAGVPQLLGGIGQAQPGTPGFEPGHNFYLLVDALEPILAAADAAGGSALMPPTAIDGFRLAMFRDPEGNPVGLIEPFAAEAEKERVL